MEVRSIAGFNTSQNLGKRKLLLTRRSDLVSLQPKPALRMIGMKYACASVSKKLAAIGFHHN
jgi:hypothetical protein